MRVLSCLAKAGCAKKVAFSSNSIILGNGLPSMHAEEGVLYKLRRLFRDNKVSVGTQLDLLVFKLTKTGKLSFSRPCRACIIRLQRSGYNIRNVYYSNETGDIIFESLASLVASKGQFSRGTRAKNNKRG